MRARAAMSSISIRRCSRTHRATTWTRTSSGLRTTADGWTSTTTRRPTGKRYGSSSPHRTNARCGLFAGDRATPGEELPGEFCPMKSFVWMVAVSLSLAALPAQAQTAIQPGLWEVTDKTTMEGVQAMPSSSKRVCVKGGEAILERLLYPSPEDFAKHGCTFTPGAKQAGIFKATTVCPATDHT